MKWGRVMDFRIGRSLFALGVALASIYFPVSAGADTDNSLLFRLPESEIGKLTADAAAGNVDAIYLRSLYLAAKGDADTAEVTDLRNRAADAGHPAAQSALCVLESLGKDEERSTANCYKAAFNGDPRAQSWLGLGLTLGLFGLEEDHATALGFYRQAAFQGHGPSLSAIGDSYHSGDGVDKDDVLAAHYWERAASVDEPSSMRELGRAYALGLGVERDLDKALNYLNRAGDLGDGAAQYYSGLVYRLKGSQLGAYVMFALSVKTLSPSELRDAAMKARSEQERLLNKADMQRARSIVSNWKKIDPKPQPFIGGIEYVKRLQTALNDRGYEAGEPDGLAGAKTRTAYRNFVDTLHMGELNFSSPDVYYVGYRLNLFGQEKPKPAAPPASSSVSAEPMPKNSAPGNSQAVVKSGGSGFIVNNEGYVVTNAHVVKGCAAVRVVQGLNEPIVASVVEISEFTDLAILRAPLISPKPVTFRNETAPRLGENIIVFGFPLTGVLSNQGNLTVGNLTALSGMRGDPGTLQISAPVQPGNSGGPVLDSKGQLIGIVVSKLNALAVAGVTDDIPQNVNFAIRATVLENLLQSRSIEYQHGETNASELPITDLAEQAKKVTVMIECVGT